MTEQSRASRRPKDQKRAPLSMRITPGVRDQLVVAAVENGRSITQEAEFRLTKSFEREGLLDLALELAYGRQAAGILMTLADEVTRQGRIGAFTSGGSFEAMENWLSDPYGYDQAIQAANTILEAFRPAGNPNALQNSKAPMQLDEVILTMGKRGAKISLAAIRDPKWGDQFPEEHKNLKLERRASQVREMLGPLVSRIPNEGDAQ